MPKPVLSDSLFNASDVATAVLQEADLQVTNSNLGVVDRSSLFVINSTNVDDFDDCKAFSFNGFMFLQGRFGNQNTAPGDDATLATISDSNFYPTYNVVFPIVSYQGDTAQWGQIDTDGNISVRFPTSAGDVHWRGTMNLWYRFN